MTLLKEELKESHCLTDETEDVLQRIIKSINRFKHTIEDLTEISRVNKDISENPADEIINIQEVYEDIMADLGYPVQQKICFTQTDFQAYQLKFSRKNFRSILYNLLSNAIKYQSPERPCILSIHTRLEEPWLVLSVNDNGLGMNARQQEQLFTMFKRFHDHVDGTGIGLYMVKRIVENAGGRIEVESEEGCGTEVKIYFKAEM
jgi:signal transduction histidine kinase